MKIPALITAFITISNMTVAQIIAGNKIVDSTKINKWLTNSKSEYHGTYNFGFSEGETYLFICITDDSCYAQITYGDWGLTDGKQDFIWHYEPLKNVRIEGNKFYSDNTNGEFVTYDRNNKKTKGLIVSTLWRRPYKKGVSEFGSFRSPNLFWHLGKYSYASYRILSESELQKLSPQDLKIMRNEIYARYHYIFIPNGEMDKYFRTQKWYSAKNINVDSFMTGLEKRNIDLIQKVEKNKNGL